MKKNLIYIIISFIITSCTDDYDLEKSVFIYDSEYKNLPEYSEWGYNTFGAYYDRKVFVSNDSEIPLKIISTNNSTSFIFKGQLNNQSSSYYSSGYYDADMTMKLTLNNYSVLTYNQLIELNDSIINLNSSDCAITLIIDNDTLPTTILNGEFEFKKVQNLLVDNEPIEVILSGLFDFQVLIGDEPTSISNGRFDIGIGESNFYNY